jgi:RND family efflux transporter MFP subunit
MPRPASHILTLALIIASTLPAGCGRNAETAPGSIAGSASASIAPGAASAPAAAASAPPVSVTTVRAQRRDLPVLLSATGTVTPLASVDVRPQVTSVVTKVHIREGQFVRAGELLFTLDARTDEANVAKARAQIVRDEAALADAQRQLARSRELLAQNFISQGALDASQTLVDSQAAQLTADRAALDAARVALSYAKITAPSSGRAGAINVFPGSSVQANQTALVTITQLDPIAVAG